ncbi:hypothetical protein EYC84_004471 [Monilinia fructicola]|uniref:AB hydrolase-1 domain-containing protein n=1 Tax=Monilinia fructicola TaxID=38448 RepID=A0A5M9K5J4_MONFR|nr:hypothetical protein EYC84_004471 [Monilinia fructicola]
MNRRDAATSFSPISGSRLASGAFFVAGTYCEPRGASTLLLATHGVIPDRGYWDVRYQPGNYNFVEFVVERGYSVLYYDRLGTGQSQVISGYLLQLPMQISILTQLLTRLHANTLLPPEIPHTIPKNIVTIGHDIGSRIAHAVIAASPSLVDAVISTGLSYRAGIPNSFGLGFASWGGKIASTVDEKWGQRGYDTGWLDQDDELAIWTM